MSTSQLPRNRRPLLIAATLAALVAPSLAGCSTSPDPAASGSASDAGASASKAPAAKDIVARTDIGYGRRATIHVGVHPLTRHGKYLTLTLDLTASDPHHDLADGSLDALDDLSSGYSEGRENAKDSGILLLDLAHDQVAAPALNQDKHVVRTKATHRDDVDTGAAKLEQVQLIYADLGQDALDLYLPKSRLLTDIPVIDTAAPKIPGESDLFDSPQAAADVVQAPHSGMSSYSHDLATQTRTRSTDASETIALSSDVLFRPDSAELDSKAKAVISSAVERLERHKAGPVTVTGFTDDVRSAAHNQALSVKRAKAVAERLGSGIDTKQYPLTVRGRGEAEPVASNDDDAGRAMNRRVELSITTPRTASAPVSKSVDPIDKPRVSGRGSTGVDLTLGAVKAHYSATARKVDGHLVVTMKVKRTDDAFAQPVGLNFDDYRDDMPKDLWLSDTAGGIAVMDGSTETLPALYHDAKGGSLLPIADVATTGRIDGGQTRVFDLVYPRDAPVGRTVTVEYPGWFRLTDIPVTE